MKSNLFSSFDPKAKSNDKFIGDMKRLMETNETQRNLILQAFPELYREESVSKREPLINDLVQKTGLNRLDIGSAHAIIEFMVKQLDNETVNVAADSPESWVEDLLSLGILEPDLAPAFTDFMRSIKQRAEKDLLSIRKERVYGAGILPSLTGVGTTVELRGIFDKEYHLGTPITEYTPQMRSVVPVISISISVNRGHPTDFMFQATQNDVDALISALEAAKKEVTTLCKSCGY